MIRRIATPVVVVLAIGAIMSCERDLALLLPGRLLQSPDGDVSLVARIAHFSDLQIIDEESPARFAGGEVVTRSAWRPYEAHSAQLADGIIRAVNRIHAAGRPIDFVIQTGDACDNAQWNELEWLLGVFDGSVIDPLSGPDERPISVRPAAPLDPHAPFTAQGLYRNGVHGEESSIPWYGVFGNHDCRSIGVFPFFDFPLAGRVAPLPLQPRPGFVLPVVLNPVGTLAYGNVTPAEPGPPSLFETPRFLPAVPTRGFYTKRDYIAAMFRTVTGPPGHGFSDPDTGPSFYSVSPLPGLRLIGLDSCDPVHLLPTYIYVGGAISPDQLDFLRRELDAARDRGELVIVATHHPSASLSELMGSAVPGSGLRALLNEYTNVVMHLAGHTHRNRVADRGGYLEIETCSTLDLPQEGRLIEIYRENATGEVVIAYEMFSHLDDDLPPLGDDPLRGLRSSARAIALADKGGAARQKLYDPTGAEPGGRPGDRAATIRLSRSSLRDSRDGIE